MKKLVFLIICFVSLDALAHSGRTNSSGCHNNRKTGGYHCHSSKTLPVPSTKARTQKTADTSQTKKDKSCELRTLLVKAEVIHNMKDKVKRLQEKTIFLEEVELKCGISKKINVRMYFTERKAQ